MKFDVNLLNTLWQNTYRASVKNQNEEYVATLRLIVNLPKDRHEVPENAPEVPAQLYVLVEDATLTSEDIIEFETSMSQILMEKFKHSIPQVFFFYPSPEDMLSKTATIEPQTIS